MSSCYNASQDLRDDFFPCSIVKPECRRRNDRSITHKDRSWSHKYRQSLLYMGNVYQLNWCGGRNSALRNKSAPLMYQANSRKVDRNWLFAVNVGDVQFSWHRIAHTAYLTSTIEYSTRLSGANGLRFLSGGRRCRVDENIENFIYFKFETKYQYKSLIETILVKSAEF